MAFEEEVVTSPMCEPGLALGTIIEAKEGSTSGESEHGDSPEPPEIRPSTRPLLAGTRTARKNSLGPHPGADRTRRLHPDVDAVGCGWCSSPSSLIFAITSGLLYTTASTTCRC
ncbi:hypothetical protein C7M84_015113 [Penaeus vannamei]|uniref:Uncharacterized protein n=1 Tax=Penaeus vannamei TaxID=6689 RepID=A0A3R7M4B6_PENVA|nr:hypothetical protein C7M84_015113 [Penaeus vannamei]